MIDPQYHDYSGITVLHPDIGRRKLGIQDGYPGSGLQGPQGAPGVQGSIGLTGPQGASVPPDPLPPGDAEANYANMAKYGGF